MIQVLEYTKASLVNNEDELKEERKSWNIQESMRKFVEALSRMEGMMPESVQERRHSSLSLSLKFDH